jgi:AcrR family transcriptional regulator
MRLDRKIQPEAVAQMKRVALRLFADRGVDGVTVREIALAAGQKNHAAVGYHFGSKEGLVRELVVDGAAAIDRLRNAMLDEMEARGGPRSARELAEALVRPSIAPESEGGPDPAYVSFVVMLSMTHRDLFMDALAERWNSGYRRCLEHLRRLMPAMPGAVQNQRLLFMGAYLGSVLAMRARALADTRRAHPTWSAETSLRHLEATIAAMLEAPLDRSLRSGFEPSKGRAKRQPEPATLGLVP